MPLRRVQYGRNDLLVTDEGRQLIDLVTNTGAVFLGHANQAVNRHITEQLDRISSSWTAVTEVQDQCKEIVARHVCEGLHLYSLYSSGMEAAEVAMRIAFHETGRTGIIGFEGHHHGKSVATQNITGVDDDLPRFDTFHRVPYLPGRSEADILRDVEEAIDSVDAAAMYVEPLQGRLDARQRLRPHARPGRGGAGGPSHDHRASRGRRAVESVHPTSVARQPGIADPVVDRPALLPWVSGRERLDLPATGARQYGERTQT